MERRSLKKKKPGLQRDSNPWPPRCRSWSRVWIQLKPCFFWVFFQASSFQLLKLKNLLRWSFFTFIYNRSSKMNYFIYTSHQFFFVTLQETDKMKGYWRQNTVGFHPQIHKFRRHAKWIVPCEITCWWGFSWMAISWNFSLAD